jgi:hypothetical protein
MDMGADTRREAEIALQLQRVAQLFQTLDPAPFHEKALDPEAHRYLFECALEQGGADALRVVIHLPASEGPASRGIEAAFHNHFRFELEELERALKRRLRVGRLSLMAGLLLLAVCSLLRSLVPEPFGGPTGFLGEGLLILGWVALWRPVDVLLFERWESRDERACLRKLARARVELVLGESAAAA